jgi:hypothetical protein
LAGLGGAAGMLAFAGLMLGFSFWGSVIIRLG